MNKLETEVFRLKIELREAQKTQQAMAEAILKISENMLSLKKNVDYLVGISKV
jgi:hypothetical protein